MGAEKDNKPAKAKAKPAKAENDSKKQWWFNQSLPIDRFTGWLVIWTFLLFIATTGLAVVAVFQWHELRSTDHNIAKQAKIANEQLAEMRAGQRAWIALASVEIGGPLEFNDTKATIWINLTLKNVGNKPAIQTNVFVHLNTKNKFIDYVNKPPFCPEINTGFGYTLFPNASTEETQGIPKTWSASGAPPQFSKSGDLTFFVEGCVFYVSVGDSAVHSTAFVADVRLSNSFLNSGQSLVPRTRYEPSEMVISILPVGNYAN